MRNKIIIFLVIAGILLWELNISEVNAKIIYENNFDDVPDWSSPSLSRISGLSTTHTEACSIGFTSYRSTDTLGEPLFIINSSNARGYSGKGLSVNVEARSAWAGGGLDIHFADPERAGGKIKPIVNPDGYEELFIRFYQKFQPNWSWGGSGTRILKIFRAYTNVEYNCKLTSGDLSSSKDCNGQGMTSYLIIDWQGTPNYVVAYREEPSTITQHKQDYDCSWNDYFSDGRWHCVEFYIKMNDIGKNNTIADIYIDGVKRGHLKSSVALRQSSDRRFNTIILFDNHVIPADTPFEEKYYIDDIVISTDYIGPVECQNREEITYPCYCGGMPDPENPGNVRSSGYCCDGIWQKEPCHVCEASPSHNCYYVAPWGNDSNDGSFERPFRTVQHGFDVISPGDYLYLRGGIYREHVEIRPYNKPQGNPSEWYTVKSYPGEWAVLNPEYNSPCPVIFYGSDSCGTHGSHGYDFCPQYWRFEHFEVTGGGTDYSDRGGGIDFDTAANIVFDQLYIHDNMGSSSSNNGGIVIRNDADAASNITIQHCYLKNNACSDLHNCGNIVLFSDYVENPRNVKISSALSNNTIRYNLIEGSAVGLKYKNSQWLSLDHTGNDIRYATHGDRVYRNIFSGQGNSAILGGQDFIQIYENIFNSSKSVSLGEAYGEDREPFYACFYNNLLINTRLNLAHDDDNAGDGSSYSAPLNEPDYHPHVYIYNNIIEDAGPETNAHNDINIFFTWTKDYQDYLNMSTVYMENNLFVPRTRTEEVINIGDNDNDYSIEEYISRGYSSTLYNSETVSGLHAEGTYKINMQFMLNDSCFIYNCGKGGSHPYLQGVSIPSYIGPCPGSECSWVDDVLALSDITALIEGGQENEKFSPADTNRNGKIELVELIEFIKKWKSNEINTMDLINAIKSWKENK